MNKPKLSWRKDKPLKGLMRIGAGPRGFGLFDLRGSKEEGSDLASVNAIRYNHQTIGWYWSAAKNEKLGITYRNTHLTPVHTPEEAKEQAKAYIVECLAKKVDEVT